VVVVEVPCLNTDFGLVSHWCTRIISWCRVLFVWRNLQSNINPSNEFKQLQDAHTGVLAGCYDPTFESISFSNTCSLGWLIMNEGQQQLSSCEWASGGIQTFLLLCALGIKLLHHAAWLDFPHFCLHAVDWGIDWIIKRIGDLVVGFMEHVRSCVLGSPEC
jgi:hypothetical protein